MAKQLVRLRPQLRLRQHLLKTRLPRRLERSRRVHDNRICPGHRTWVRKHHCCVPACDRLPIECAHVRSGTDGGIGLKPSDRWLISLCSHHHQEQHRIGETAFEKRYGIDLIELSREFARLSPHRSGLKD
jgi:hypothetical protein